MNKHEGNILSKNRPLILIVNDDGIRSPGLHAAAEVALSLGDILIVAPAQQQTAMSRARSNSDESGVITTMEISLNGTLHVGYAVASTPALCVAHAMVEIADRKPDLCLSGINYGENIGFSVTGSGTLGAALEAASFGIPAIASSLETPMSMNHTSDYAQLDWQASKHHLHKLASLVLEHGLPDDVAVLNLNVPDSATEDTEQRFTRLSTHNYYNFDHIGANSRDYNQPYRLTESRIADKATLEPDSDIYAFVHDRVVSITPIARTLSAPLNTVTEWFN